MKLQLDRKTEQVNAFDERFYTKDHETYHPSVTTVLQSYPKGQYFEQWLMDTGRNSEKIKVEAGIQGTRVHNAIDEFLQGDTLTLIDDDRREKFTLNEWKMICRFMIFWEFVEKENFLSESILFDDVLRLGGTTDLVCTINNERWMIDYKTSNALHDTYRMQLAMYKQMYENTYDDKIDRYGVLWLNAKTKTDRFPMQGKGWQLKEYTKDFEKDFKLFGHTRAIWDNEFPDYKPKNLSYPNTFKLEK
jgi:hypothetical protein